MTTPRRLWRAVVKPFDQNAPFPNYRSQQEMKHEKETVKGRDPQLWLRDGDQVTIIVENIGALNNPVVAG